MLSSISDNQARRDHQSISIAFSLWYFSSRYSYTLSLYANKTVRVNTVCTL